MECPQNRTSVSIRPRNICCSSPYLYEYYYVLSFRTMWEQLTYKLWNFTPRYVCILLPSTQTFRKCNTDWLLFSNIQYIWKILWLLSWCLSQLVFQKSRSEQRFHVVCRCHVSFLLSCKRVSSLSLTYVNFVFHIFESTRPVVLQNALQFRFKMVVPIYTPSSNCCDCFFMVRLMLNIFGRTTISLSCPSQCITSEGTQCHLSNYWWH